jgi:hypothetical protein
MSFPAVTASPTLDIEGEIALGHILYVNKATILVLAAYGPTVSDVVPSDNSIALSFFKPWKVLDGRVTTPYSMDCSVSVVQIAVSCTVVFAGSVKK